MGSNRKTHASNGMGQPFGSKPTGSWENIKLTWRLLRDPRVAPYAKVILPILALVYLISPIDVIPDMILGLGQVDDIGVLALVAYLLVSYVKRAGWATILEQNQPPASRGSTSSEPPASDEIIDAQFRVIPQARVKRAQGKSNAFWGSR